MNLAKPAPRVEAATAESAIASPPVENDNYKVEPISTGGVASSGEEYKVEEYKVGPAVTVDDPRKFAPTQQLNEPYRNPDFDISVDKLRSGNGGVSFQSKAGVCKGIHMTCTRTCLPFLYDPRDFVSYGEILRYVVIKDNYCFVYGQETDPNPIFSVLIDNLRAVKEDPNRPHKRSITVSPMANTNLQSHSLQTVLLLDARTNSLVYQFTFDVATDPEIGNYFINAVEIANQIGKAKDKGYEHHKATKY